MQHCGCYTGWRTCQGGACIVFLRKSTPPLSFSLPGGPHSGSRKLENHFLLTLQAASGFCSPRPSPPSKPLSLNPTYNPGSLTLAASCEKATSIGTFPPRLFHACPSGHTSLTLGTVMGKVVPASPPLPHLMYIGEVITWPLSTSMVSLASWA